jgi:hypothetical protein
MTDNTNLDLLRQLDPLDVGTTTELDPDGTTGRRVHAAAIAAAQQPGLAAHGATATRRAPRRGPRIAMAGAGVAALAAVALAVGLPGGGGGSPTAPGPADARAALVSAAERTTAFTSGHIVWKMDYNQPSTGAPGVKDANLVMTSDFRYEGSDVDIAGTTDYRVPGPKAPDSAYGVRVVGGQIYWRYDDGPFELDKNPRGGGDGATGVQTRVQAADALAAAARSAADVQQAAIDGGTQYTATVAADDVPDQFRPPFKRTVDSVAITAIVGDNGALRSLALRAPGEAIDVTFSELGQPQHIVAP